MRPLHLVGLRGGGDEELTFHPEGHVPLVLTSLIPAMDQEQILGFYQQVLVPRGQLPRIEVEWGQSLLPTDRAFLRAMRERHGAQQALVVVRVLRDQPNVDLQQILMQPEIDAFQHVAISALDPMENESLVRLAELARFVADVAQERYEEIANELGLCPEAFNTIQHRVRMLLNPVDILEAVNALIDVQDEAKAIALATPRASGDRSVSEAVLPGAAAPVEDQVVWRILSRMIDARPVEEQVLLSALTLNKEAELLKLPSVRLDAAHARLRAAQLIRNDELSGWASWLKEPKQESLLRTLIARASARRRGEIRLLGHARNWFRDHYERKAGDHIHTRVMAIFGLIQAGQYGRAEEELKIVWPFINEGGVTDEIQGDYWYACGRLKLATGQANEGIDALKRADTLMERGQVHPLRRCATMDALARVLSDNGFWQDAEPVFRKALRLMEEGGASPISRAITMHAFSCRLHENGRWLEAEPLLRQAIHLAEEGGEKPANRAIPMHTLACALRDDNRWSEAEPIFRKALYLQEEGGNQAHRAATIHEFARGLRDNGQWSEAESLFRHGIRFAEENGESPDGRGVRLDDLARGLRDNGRWSEAEPLFRQALDLKEKGSNRPASRGITLDHLARGLRDNGQWPEAEPLFREAIRLKEEGADTPASRAATMRELARGLRKNGKGAEADALMEQAERLTATVS